MAAVIAWFSGKKTYFIVVLGLLTVLVNFLSGDMSLMQFIASDEFIKVLELLGLGAIRAGVTKSGPVA